MELNSPGAGLWLARLALILLLGCYLWLIWQLLRWLRSGADQRSANAVPSQRRPRPLTSVWYLLSAILCFIPLLDYWTSGFTGATLLGLLPWSDAAGWLYGTLHLASTGLVDDWTARRPLNALFLYSHWLLGDGLTGLLALRAALLSLALGCFCYELNRATSVVPALCSALLLSLFAYSYSPTLLTEANGLIYGLFGFALLIRGAHSGQSLVTGCGMLLLTLGLLMRMGAIGVLPMLLFWLWFSGLNRTRNTTTRTQFLTAPWVLGAAGVGVALAFGALWRALIYDGANSSGANFSYTLYGLTHSGAPWQLFFEHHPQSVSLPESSQASLAYAASWNQFVQDPWATFTGAWKFFCNYWRFQFSWVPGSLQYYLLPLFLLGLARCLFLWRQPVHQLLLFALLGIVVTTPLIYWSANAARAFIVTTPVEVAIIGLGLATALDWLREPTWWRTNLATPVAPSSVGYRWLRGLGLCVAGLHLTLIPAGGLLFSSYQHPAESTQADAVCTADELDLRVTADRWSPRVQIVQEQSFWPRPGQVELSQLATGQQHARHPIGDQLIQWLIGENLPTAEADTTAAKAVGELIFQFDPALPGSFHFLFVPAKLAPDLAVAAPSERRFCALGYSLAERQADALKLWRATHLLPQHPRAGG